MKKVLFLIGSYPSNRSANVLCDEKIIKILSKNNYDVTCLVTKSYNTSKYEEIEGVKVHRVYRSWFYNTLFWAKDNNDWILSKLILIIDRIIMRAKQIVFIPIYPSTTPLFSRKFARTAIKLNKKENFDLVIAEYSSFETLYAGYILKRKFPDIVFMPIFWDSLSGGFLAKYLPQKYCIKKRYEWEERLTYDANSIVVMNSSKEHHECYSKNRIHYNRLIYLDNPLFTKKEIIMGENNIINKERISILFTGYLNKKDRDPSYIIDLFNKLNRNDITLIFIGSGNCHEILEKARINFKGQLLSLPYMKYEDLVQIYQQADILLNLGVSNKNAISSKIFEYMSYGKPIISTYYIDDEASLPYLKKYPLALFIDQREKDGILNLNKLNEFIKNNLGKVIRYEELVGEFYNNTPEAYLDLVNSLFSIEDN